MSKIVPSMQSILQTHTVPGQYLHLFKSPKKSIAISIQKTAQKKKKKEIQRLDHLIPKIESALELASQEPFLKRLLKGVTFQKIDADSQTIVLYYSQHQKSNADQQVKNLNISKGLIYKYLTRQISVKSFPSRLEFKKYSFKQEKLDEIYSRIEAELGFKGKFKLQN